MWSTVLKNGKGSVQLSKEVFTQLVSSVQLTTDIVSFSVLFPVSSQLILIPGWVFKQNDSTDTQIKKTDAPATTCKQKKFQIAFPFQQGASNAIRLATSGPIDSNLYTLFFLSKQKCLFGDVMRLQLSYLLVLLENNNHISVVDVVGWYLGRGGGIRFVEQSPNLRFESLPCSKRTSMEGLLIPKHPSDLFIARPLRIQIQLIQDSKGRLEMEPELT